jgi:phosphohistidine phosphatase
VARACGYDAEIEIEPEMYLSGEEAYLDRIRALPEAVARVLVVGHNPDVENLVFALSGHTETMPTAALARIDLPVETWGEVRAGVRGALNGVWRPRELAAD